MATAAARRTEPKTPPRATPRRAIGRPRRDIPPNRLTALRERHKAKGGLWLTTAEVATLTGIAESDVSRHENHERGLTEAHVMAYAKVFKVKPHQLFANLTVTK